MSPRAETAGPRKTPPCSTDAQPGKPLLVASETGMDGKWGFTAEVYAKAEETSHSEGEEGEGEGEGQRGEEIVKESGRET